MKLEKFNLEEALNGAKVVTRTGLEVTQLTKFQSDTQDLIFGKIDKSFFAWYLNGRYYSEGASDLDLFIAVEPKRVWVNVYRIYGHIGLSAIYFSKEGAESKGILSNNYIKTIEITDEL